MAPDPVNIFEYEEIAKERLEKGHYDFIAGAATDEITPVSYTHLRAHET